MGKIGYIKGKCPYCESGDLDYSDEGFDDPETYCIRYNCTACGRVIVEHYCLQYIDSEIISETISVDDKRIKPLF